MNPNGKQQFRHILAQKSSVPHFKKPKWDRFFLGSYIVIFSVLLFLIQLLAEPAMAQEVPASNDHSQFNQKLFLPLIDIGTTPTDRGPADIRAAMAGYQLGDLPMIINQGGWGPIEIDTSVGEAAPGDGGPMTINGQSYAHGLGTHATSVISYELEGKCISFSSWVGIDDEVATNAGSVIFQVYADGQQLFDSGLMTGADAAQSTGVLDMAGVSELMLIVQDGGNYAKDHANWAEPTVICNSQPNGDGSSFKQTRGSWGSVLQWPVKAIHASLLPSGHIISHASADPGQIGSNDPNAPHSSTKVDLSNINNWSHEWVDHPSEEMYCSAHTLLADGSLFEFGGHGGANPNFLFYGQDQASKFDFGTKSWSQMENMQQARWYPSALTLGNGDVMAIGGSHAGGNSFTPEIFDGSSWRTLSNVNYQNRLNNNDFIFDHTYPFVQLVSDGRVFWAGWDEEMAYINTNGNGSWSQNYFRENLQRAWGAPIMYRTDKLLLIGGVDHQGTYGTATNSVVNINLSGNSPSVAAANPMLFPRADADGTILANGDVFMNGGGYYHVLDANPTHIYVPETWDPATGTWQVGAAATNPRGYHSSSLLLPDGRVWTGGGECGGACNKGKTAQIYTPPYLYKQDASGTLASRPTINNVDSPINYGQSFNANISTNTGVSKVTLIRLGSSTHHINFEQKYLELAYQLSGSTLSISAPSNGNLAPPGYYMLFVFNNSGVPSVAKMVQITQSTGNPTPTPTPADPNEPTPTPTATPTPVGEPSCNVISNPGFENGLANWTSFGTLTLTDDAYAGNNALVVTNGWGGQIVSATAGENYTFSGRFKLSGGSAWAGVGIDFYNSSGAEIGESQTQLLPTTSYQPFSISGIAPSGTTQIQMWLYSGSPETLTVDDLTLKISGCDVPNQPTPTPTDTPEPSVPTPTPTDPPEPSAPTPTNTPEPSVPTPTPTSIAGCNLLQNGDFEAGISNWSSYGALSPSTDAYEGAAALAVSNGWAGQIVPVAAAGEYTLSGYYKSMGNPGWTGIGIDFLNSSGAEVGEAFTQLADSAAYALFSTTGTAPAGATQIQVWLYRGSGDPMIVDTVDLRISGCSG